MNTMEKWSLRTRWGIALFWTVVAVAIGLGLTLLLPSLADSPGPNLPGDVGPLAQRRTFIGLPDVNTFSVQNILSETTHITVTFALPDGTIVETFTDTVPPESAYIHTAPENFTGLAHIESDRRIHGIDFELSDSGNDAYLGLEFGDEDQAQQAPLAPGCYGGYIPLVVKAYQGWSTVFTIQNRLGSYTGNLAVWFYDQGGDVVHTVYSMITLNGSESFDLADMADVENGYIGSVFYCADQPLTVASVRTYNDGLGLRSAYRGGTPLETSHILIVPALFKASDLQTSEICVQNAGGITQTVSVTYTDGLTDTTPINPHALNCFDQGMEGHDEGWTGGAIITGEEQFFAVVNVTAYNGITPVGRWSYTVPGQNVVTDTLALPLLFNSFEGWTSEIHLYNFNSSSSVITPRFVSYPAGFVHCAEPFTIPAHAVHSISQSELPRAFDVSMAYFTATQPVVAVVSATSNKPLGDADRHFGYGAAYPDIAISFPDTCDTIREVFLPLTLKDGTP